MPRALYICLWIFLWVPAAMGDAGLDSDDALRAILRARSVPRVREIAREESRRSQARLACDVQQLRHRIPSACFVARPTSAADGLSALCAARAGESEDPAELRAAIQRTEVPEACRRAASVRLEDLRYRTNLVE